MTVADTFDPKRNGLTSLRLLLSLTVALGHSYQIGGFGPDPLHAASGVTLGELAVNSFFALSGFLVTQSWLNTPRLGVYAAKRALRLFPRLWACLIITGLGLFPWLAHRLHGAEWPAVIFNADHLGYVFHNALLKLRQPGVGQLFLGQPVSGLANGSLWSLLPEALCYLGVIGLAIIGAFRSGLFRRVLIAALALWLIQALSPVIWPGLKKGGFGAGWWLWRLTTQAAFFTSGTALCVLANKIPATRIHLSLALAALLTALGLGFYAWVAPVLLPYTLLLISAKIPTSPSAHTSDYSYGIYLYHFPVQQTLVALGLATAGPLTLYGASLLATGPLAAFSWWFVERPALQWSPVRP